MTPLSQMEAAVCVAPADDEVRRAYAARAGSLRGRFVDIQLESAEARRRGDHEQAIELDAAAFAMLLAHEAQWLPAKLATFTQDPLWSRGFVESVTMTAENFYARSKELFALAPIRAIKFTNVDDIERLAASPDLERLVYLELRDNDIGDRGARALAASPYVTRLRGLHLVNCGITREGLDALAALANVRYVALAGNPSGDPVETTSVDNGSVTATALPALGAELEAKHGRISWLHGPSEWAVYPPSLADVLA